MLIAGTVGTVLVLNILSWVILANLLLKAYEFLSGGAL